MANELEHFSVLDDESSTSYFLNWANNFGGGSKLRGGDSVVSNTSSDAHIEVEVEVCQVLIATRFPITMLM